MSSDIILFKVKVHCMKGVSDNKIKTLNLRKIILINSRIFLNFVISVIIKTENKMSYLTLRTLILVRTK